LIELVGFMQVSRDDEDLFRNVPCIKVFIIYDIQMKSAKTIII